MTDLLTITEAARQLRLSRQTVAELVRETGIKTEPFPYNGSARGLTPEHMRILRASLAVVRQPAKATA